MKWKRSCGRPRIDGSEQLKSICNNIVYDLNIISSKYLEHIIKTLEPVNFYVFRQWKLIDTRFGFIMVKQTDSQMAVW